MVWISSKMAAEDEARKLADELNADSEDPILLTLGPKERPVFRYEVHHYTVVEPWYR